LPAALLVVFWWKRGGLSWRREVRPLLPFFAVGLVSGIYTAWVEHRFVGADPHDFPYSLLERCLIAGRVFCFYLGKLGWPARLIFNYPRWQISAAVGWQYLYPVAALLLLGGAWAWRKRNRGPLAGLLFFAGTLFPALGFVNVYPFRYAFVADHFQYLASLGAFTLVAAGAVRFAEMRRWPSPRIGQAAGLLLLAALAGLTWWQSTMYADSETLYQRTLADNPDSWLSHNNLGIARFEQGRVDEAVAHWRAAIALQPGNVESYRNLGVAALERGRIDEAIAYYQKALQLNPLYAGAHYNLGNALFKKGRVKEAVAHWQKALAIQPDYADAYTALGVALFQQGQFAQAVECYHQALAFAPDSAEAHYNLGNALLKQGAVDEAVAEWQKALVITPGNALAHKNLGMVFAQQERMDEAIAHWQLAVALQPDDADTHRNLGVALFKKGRAAEAVAHWQKSLELDPGQIRTRISLAWVLATWPVASVRNGAKALELARQADQLSGGNNPLVLRTLAAAYAETGQFSEAEATVQRALSLALAQNNSDLAATLRAQLKLHQAGAPCREPASRPAQP
jgi:tetratricopeptide (TPR) repeat protein